MQHKLAANLPSPCLSLLSIGMLRSHRHAPPAMSLSDHQPAQLSPPPAHAGPPSSCSASASCLSSGRPAPVTQDVCLCLVMLSNFPGLLKPSYLCIWAVPNCFPPNFNKGRGLVSPISQPGPRADSAQCLMSVAREGSRHSQRQLQARGE